MKSIEENPTELDERLRWLLRKCAAADSEALQLLYTLVSPILFASIIRILRRPALAEEALQDVFISIWQKAGKFSTARGRPTADGEPEPEGGAAAWRPTPDLMKRCLALLSAQQAHCLELAYINGNSHEDIARLTGRPLGTVKSWIRRALLNLRQCLASYHDI